MKIKHLIIVSLILAILTIGAVSASQTVDDAAADDAQGDLIKQSSEDDKLAEPTGDYENETTVPEEISADSDWEYDDHVATVELPDDATGIIAAYLDGNKTPFYNEAADEYNYIDLDGIPLSFGLHNILINYSGDSKYIGFANKYNFNVTYEIEYDADDVEYGDDAIVDVTAPMDIKGNLTLQFKNKTYQFKKIFDDYGDECFRCKFAGYDFGVNNFTITLLNDPKYPNKTVKGTFTVEENWRVPLEMIYNDGSNVTLILPKNATGSLNVTVDDESFALVPLVNGKAVVSLNGISVGTHNIVAKYTGTDYDIDYWDDDEFDVDPDVVIPSYVYSKGGNYTLTISLGENTTGTLEVIKNGNTIFDEAANGTKTFRFAPADDEIEIIYDDGDYRYDETFNVHVRDENPVWQMNITYDNTIIQGHTIFIHVNEPDSSDMSYTIYVDSKMVSENGYPEFDTSKLAVGPHSFTITAIDEDGYYISQSKSGSFNVTLVQFSVPSTIKHRLWYTDYIYVYTAENVTGSVSLILNGKDYLMEFIDEDGTFISLDNLPCGDYDYEIIYTGNSPSVSQKGKFNVTYTFAIDMDSVYAYGEKISIISVLPLDATGTITLKIGNETYTGIIVKDDEDFKVDFNLTTLPLGKYNATFTYNGDAKYNYPQTVKKSFEVDGFEIVIYPDEEVYVGQEAYVTISLPSNATGNLTVTVDGKDYANVKLKNGFANVSLKNITLGGHNLTAAYTGDDYSVDPIVIDDNEYEVSIFEDHSYNIPLNGTGWISVILPANAKGNITLTFDGDKKTSVNLTASEILNYTISNIKKLGEHVFTLHYTGDDYNIDEYLLTEYDFIVTPNEMVVPYADEKNTGNEIALTLPEDAKGNLTVYVLNGTTGEYDVFAKVAVNGSDAKASLANMTPGVYDVKFEYKDEKYGTFTKEFEYRAKKPVSKIDISFTVDGTTVMFDFELEKDANGTLIIKFDDKFYSRILAGGKANLTVENLINGKQYVVEVKYSGSEKYLGSSVNTTVTIPKAPAKITAKDMTVTYTSKNKYTVTVYDENGELAKNAKVIILINGKKAATLKTDDKGVATYKITQKPGTYKITAQALGASVTKKLTVKHVLKLKKVKVKKSAKKLIIKATLVKVDGKYINGKKITLKFKGKKYKVKTNKKGVAKFTIKKKVLKKLKVGKKVTYQATYLKDTVKYTVKVKK